jgi:hypothetical protein
MSGDGTEFEYPDEAGYPDGMGTLHEGTETAASMAGDDLEQDLEEFAEDDEEDDEGV